MIEKLAHLSPGDVALLSLLLTAIGVAVRVTWNISTTLNNILNELKEIHKELADNKRVTDDHEQRIRELEKKKL